MTKYIRTDNEFDINAVHSKVKVGDILPKGRANFFPSGVKKDECLFFGSACIEHRTGALVVFRVGPNRFVVAKRDSLDIDWEVVSIATSMKAAMTWENFGDDTCGCPPKPRGRKATASKAAAPESKASKPKVIVQRKTTKSKAA